VPGPCCTNVDRRCELDEMIDGIPGENLDAFAYDNRCDRRPDFHIVTNVILDQRRLHDVPAVRIIGQRCDEMAGRGQSDSTSPHMWRQAYVMKSSQQRDLTQVHNDDQRTAINAGEDGSIVVGKILEKDAYAFGYDVQTGEYGNLVSKGIIDPTKVVRVALQGATRQR
jgi:hypothetical protein